MVERLGWTLLHFVWEGALVALALAVALAFVRRSARARYALALLALGSLVAAPVATYRALAPTLAPAPVDGSSGLVRVATQRFVAATPSFEAGMPTLVAAWAVGVALLSLRLGARLVRIERWRRRHARPAEREWQTRLDALARGMGLRRAIRLLVSDRIAVPAAWGVFRAVVVLPSSLLAGLSPAQIETILLHELAHIRRHDYLVNLLQAVVETLLFYHPAVWWVSGVARREREHCCDDAVVARLGDPMPYARALLHLEERRLTLPRPTLSAKEGHLMNRIARILSPQSTPTRVSPLASSLAALGVLGAILGGTLQAQAQAKPQAKPSALKKKPAVAAKPTTIKVRVAKPARAITLPVSVHPVRIFVQAPMPAPSVFRWVPAKAATAPVATPAPAFAPVTRTVIAQVPVLGDIPLVRRLFRGPATRAPAFAAPLPSPVRMTPTQPAQDRPVAAMGGFGGQSGVGGFADPARVEGGSAGMMNLGGGVWKQRGGSGGGLGQFGTEEVRVEAGSNGTVTVDVKDASLASVLRQLARTAKLSIVIEGGDYREVTMVLTEQPTAEAITILCRAANATWRKEGNVYYVVPRG